MDCVVIWCSSSSDSEDEVNLHSEIAEELSVSYSSRSISFIIKLASCLRFFFAEASYQKGSFQIFVRAVEYYGK